MMHTTIHKRTARRILTAAASAAVIVTVGLGYANHADAAPVQRDVALCVHAEGGNR